ncbi:BPSL1445 family SYLF domain-containing lipoprotein [Halotalea alkalilenta]|uniref:BPSL1445 family SYLF domain-containing lipoprotein n=1 Tax=Halotalea alkalilenta TaxID=376489 RepID=UPI00048601AD|nr:YSC84-related protein [Halotalea alkalilenta]
MRNKEHWLRRTGALTLAALLAGGALAGCTTTTPQDRSDAMTQQRQIDNDVQQALERLYRASPEARELVSRAKGVLVFPGVIGASFVVGAEHGDGALLIGNQTSGYYTTTAGSIGFQAGAQSRAIIYLFMTDQALRDFTSSNGWTVGADASVAVADVGASGNINTNTMQQPIIGFVMNNAGIQAGVSLQGAKISPR